MSRLYTMFALMNEAGADSGGAATAPAPTGTMLGGPEPAPAPAPSQTPAPAPGTQPPAGTASDDAPVPDQTVAKNYPVEDWRNGLPEEFRTEYEGYLGKYPTLEEAIKGGVNAQKMIGNSIRLPGEDATPDEIAKFWNKIGRPEDSGDYPDPVVKTFTNDAGEEVPIFELDGETWQETRKSFHEMGLTPKQMQSVMDLYGQQRLNEFQQGEASLETQMVEMRRQSENELMQEWGDKFDVNMSIARKTIEKFGLMEDLKSMGLGNSGAVAKMFLELSQHIGEATLTGDFVDGHKSFDEARSELVNHPAYADPMHPQHSKIKQRVDALYSKRYPGQEG